MKMKDKPLSRKLLEKKQYISKVVSLNDIDNVSQGIEGGTETEIHLKSKKHNSRE